MDPKLPQVGDILARNAAPLVTGLDTPGHEKDSLQIAVPVRSFLHDSVDLSDSFLLKSIITCMNDLYGKHSELLKRIHIEQVSTVGSNEVDVINDLSSGDNDFDYQEPSEAEIADNMEILRNIQSVYVRNLKAAEIFKSQIATNQNLKLCPLAVIDTSTSCNRSALWSTVQVGHCMIYCIII